MRSGDKQSFQEVAALDMGSNSFHLVVARLDNGSVKVVDRVRETVRLAAGLDEQGNLTEAAEENALASLERLGQRLRELPAGSVRAVGTNTLRQARNSKEFLRRASAGLGHEVEVISGYEEARLIYLGVAHSLADDGAQRLVVDIGGGSTEFILGRGFEPEVMESLHMGCVSLTNAHFPDGGLTKKRMQKAILAAQRELEPVRGAFRQRGWQRVLGSSGTIKAIDSVLEANGWSCGGITSDGLKKLRKAVINAGSIEKLKLKGLSERRAQVLPGGLAVLSGAFEALGIDRMEYADGALREGALYDLLGRIRHEDVRGRTVAAMASRYHVDWTQVGSVRATALDFLGQVREPWGLTDELNERLLRWAAELHEIGLDISHSSYHKHGAYIVSYADMAGFSREEQRLLAALVRAHRRKFASKAFDDLPGEWARAGRRLAVLLRLAVVLRRGRNEQSLPQVTLHVADDRIRVSFPSGWLDEHPLAAADLDEEAGFLAAAGFELDFA
jgi:exopolyphosphatase/guanosine-5'-triphosphate,3'-diphosphate pyrophosphatase